MPVMKEKAQQAVALRESGQLEEALALFESLRADQPEEAWTVAHYGETLRLLDRQVEALVAFNRALKLKPDYLWALAHRATVLYVMRSYEASLTDLNQVLNTAPTYIWALAYRPHCYIAKKKYDLALADVDAFLDIDTNILPHWKGERGMVLNYLERFDEVLAQCGEAIREDQQDYIAHYTYAVASFFTKTDGAALNAAEACLDAVKDSGDPGLIAYRRGGLAAMRGNRDEALDYLALAIERHPEPIETARHDPVWRIYHADPTYKALIHPAEAWINPYE